MKKKHRAAIHFLLDDGADPLELIYEATNRLVLSREWKPRPRLSSKPNLIMSANLLCGLAIKLGLEQALFPVVVVDSEDEEIPSPACREQQ